jgi:drug/metabolite transporter (DMT)-like permease
MKKKKNFLLGTTYAFINMISLGILGIVDKIGATHTVNPFVFSTQSVFFSLLFVTIFAFLYKKNEFIREIKHTPFSAWRLLFFIGIFSSGLFILFRFLGLLQSTGTFATLSQVIITALTAVLAMFFLKEKLPRIFWLFFFIIIVAMYFVSIGKFALATLGKGDSYIIIGAIFVAFANLFSKKALAYVSPVILTMGRFFFGTLLLLVISLFVFHFTSVLLTFSIWSLASGLLWTVNATAFSFSIQKLGVTLAASILMIAPVVTMVLEYTILKQIFNPVQITAALIVVICGILMVVTKERALFK